MLADACLAVTPYLRDEAELPLALALAERGLSFDPTDLRLAEQRALVLKRLGRLEEARAAFEALLEGGHESLELRNNLGNLLLELGRPAEALEQLQRAVELAPDNPVVRRNLQRAQDALEDLSRRGR
jgi:Flp pilus assembly protein TadD